MPMLHGMFCLQQFKLSCAPTYAIHQHKYQNNQEYQRTTPSNSAAASEYHVSASGGHIFLIQRSEIQSVIDQLYIVPTLFWYSSR